MAIIKFQPHIKCAVILYIKKKSKKIYIFLLFFGADGLNNFPSNPYIQSALRFVPFS